MPEPYGVIAIDSKFPFSEYAKLFDNKNLTKEEEEKIISAFGADVKKRITEISSKYIIEGITVDFALMFVASDGVLSLLHSKLPNVIEYSANKKVTIVSPTTLIPLLSSFLAIRIDYERSKYSEQIKDELSMLKKEFVKFDVEWAKLHDNIQKLTKQSIDVNSRVEKISTKFNKISTDKILNYQEQPLLSDDNSEED
jgi:DNA recombination protein RmuC